MSLSDNLRRLRLFVAASRTGSMSRAAMDMGLSQPAVTQSLKSLEDDCGAALLVRRAAGVYPTDAGMVLISRAERAFDLLDRAFASMGPRLKLTATAAQLNALVALSDSGTATLAARGLGIAQPTLLKALSRLEAEAVRPLTERRPQGLRATPAGEALANAVRLAFAEIAQAEMDLAEAGGREAGQIVVGAMPLARSHGLADVIIAFRRSRPALPIVVREGPYRELLLGLRRGQIDLLVGALRDPPPAHDIVQEPLFQDRIAFVAGPRHPLARAGAGELSAARLSAYPWVVAAEGTPIRDAFDRFFADAQVPRPESVVSTSSLILMRQLLLSSDHLGCVSGLQAGAEIALGLMLALPVPLPATERPIGITTRADWQPTRAQGDFLSEVRARFRGPAAYSP